MYPVRLSIKGSNNRTVPCAYASPATNGLLVKLIYFTERAKFEQRAFFRQVGAPKLIYTDFFPNFSTFFIITNLLLYVRCKNIHFKT